MLVIKKKSTYEAEINQANELQAQVYAMYLEAAQEREYYKGLYEKTTEHALSRIQEMNNVWNEKYAPHIKPSSVAPLTKATVSKSNEELKKNARKNAKRNA